MLAMELRCPKVAAHIPPTMARLLGCPQLGLAEWTGSPHTLHVGDHIRDPE
jgi:hypothetical protein